MLIQWPSGDKEFHVFKTKKKPVIKGTPVIFHFYLSENTIKEYIKTSHEAGELFSTRSTDKGTVYSILQRVWVFFLQLNKKK